MARFLVTYTNGRQFPIEADSPAQAGRIANELAQESGQSIQRVNNIINAPIQPGSPLTQPVVGDIISVGGQDFGTQRQTRSAEVIGQGQAFVPQSGVGDLNPIGLAPSAPSSNVLSAREAEKRRAEEFLSVSRPTIATELNRIDNINNSRRKLIETKESPNGTTYRLYEYTYERRTGNPITERVVMLVNADAVGLTSRAELNETPVDPSIFDRDRMPEIFNLTPNDLLVTGTKTGFAVNDIREAYARNSNSDLANIPSWFTNTLALNNIEFRPIETGDGFIQYSTRGTSDADPSALNIDLTTGQPLPSAPSGPLATGQQETPTGTETAPTPTVGDFDPSVSAPEGPGTGAAPITGTGPGATANQTGNIARIEDVPGEFLDFDVTDALSNFLATSPALGINLPVDADGNRRNITPDDFPGFPPEILDPNNLFIRVTETTSIPDEDGNMIPATSTRVVPNPAVELLLAQYAERVRALTDLQGSADDILQAQVSASGGLFGGPTGSLSLEQLEDLERETRSIQASGGRLVQERVFDAEGEPTGQFREVLTPLGQQELTQEALRQSGGLLGGFYTPLDASGQPLEGGGQRFVQGFTPQQLLQRQEEEARRARQQELEVLERQREADLQLARINQAPQTFRNIADLYSNPAQLAAIVASGGSPLLRGQLPGSVPLPQTAMQTGAMTPQQASATPFNITNPSGTVFDPNFEPVGGRTIEGDLRRQEANPFNVRDFSGITEDRLNRLTDIELARAQGEAAAQGITPNQLQDIALGNTPGQAGSPLQGYLAPSALFR